VVQRQGRLDEAKRLYERALSSDPRALAARGNLARLLFMLGEDAAADREFKRFISDYFLHWKGTEELPPPGFTTVDLASAYRNLGIVAFNLGHIDDANCWFQEALNLSSAAYTPREYGRLLSFMERWDLAEQFYRQRLELGEGDAPDPVLLADYGIVLFAEKRFEEAEQVFQRIPGVQGVDAQTRLLARFMKRLTAKERGAQSVGAELNEEIAEELSQESANYCETDFSAEYTYWPPEVVQKAAKYLDEICGRESSDVKEVNE
jgi:tetratricopeptide (TPR) repeat protein